MTDEFSSAKDCVTWVAGSFFEPDTIPRVEDGDAYYLRIILHDWGVEDCLKILRENYGKPSGPRERRC